MAQKIVLIFKCVNCGKELKIAIDEFMNRELSLYKSCPECEGVGSYLFLRRAYENDYTLRKD